jgi:hypothetical protein
MLWCVHPSCISNNSTNDIGTKILQEMRVLVTNRNTNAKIPIEQSLIQQLGSMLTSIKIVFSYWPYIALTGTIATIFWIVFNVFEQLLFFSPIVVFYLPEDAITGFILSNITAILLGIVVSMNVYVFNHSRGIKLNATSFFSGSTIGVLSSLCKLLFTWLSSSFYTRRCKYALSTFLSNYQTPLRIISALVLESHKPFLGKRIDIASDEVTGEQAAEILSNELGYKIKYVPVPIERVYQANEDMARMYD